MDWSGAQSGEAVEGNWQGHGWAARMQPGTLGWRTVGAVCGQLHRVDASDADSDRRHHLLKPVEPVERRTSKSYAPSHMVTEKLFSWPSLAGVGVS